MGRLILALAREDARFRVAGAVEAPGHATVGRDAGELAGGASLGVRAHGCLSKDGDWTLLHARRAGTFVLTSDFDLIPNQKQRGGTCATPGS